MKWIQKKIRIYYFPVIIFLFALELAAFLLILHLEYFSDMDRLVEVSIESALMLIATFIGIFVPIQINRNQKKEDDRRILKFTLSSLWNEIRGNLHILKQIKLNYEFSKIMNFIPGPLHMVSTLYTKFDGLVSQDKLFKYEAFIATQQSGSITTFDEDFYYNDVNQSYENLSLFRSSLVITSQDIKMKRYLFSQGFDPVTLAEAEQSIEGMERTISKCKSELELAIKYHEKSIKSLGNKLKDLGIKTKIEERKKILEE